MCLPSVHVHLTKPHADLAEPLALPVSLQVASSKLEPTKSKKNNVHLSPLDALSLWPLSSPSTSPQSCLHLHPDYAFV